jgi:tetratricopeptide (TPR) repeat protein
MRSSLLRLEAVHPVLNRLPRNERVARIESPEGLSHWLQQQLTAADASTTGAQEYFDRYSTHPVLPDRLAALPEDNSVVEPSPSALTLLAEPDKIALQLVAHIERIALEQEKKDLVELRKWLRSARRTGHYRAAQLPGGALALIAGVCGLVALPYGMWQASLVFFLLILPLGLWFYWLGRYHDRRDLPVPDLKSFLEGRKNFPLPDLKQKQLAMEVELNATITGERNASRKAARLIDEAYAALGRCDYLRAHIAGRLAADHAKHSVERALVMAIATTAFGQGDTANDHLEFAQKKTGLRSSSSQWAVAWALMLRNDWMKAEALLHATMHRRQDDPNLRAVLAYCQGRRGKLQSAIENFRACCTLRAPTEQHLRQFISLLLDRGALREATERFKEFGPAALYDPEVIFLRLQLHLLRHDFDRAAQELTLLHLDETPGNRLLEIAFLYENARTDAKAAEFYERALKRGHYPQAWLGLARRAHKAKDKAQARLHVHTALDVSKEPAEHAVSAYALFSSAIALLRELEELTDQAKAWIVHVQPGKNGGPLAKHSLLIYATTQQDAQGFFSKLMQVMQPADPLVPPAFIVAQLAGKDMQPIRPVFPGVQYVYQ